MTEKDFSLTVLGPRGSMAVSRSDITVFGGDSSCYMVRAGDETVFLDAGSGLISAPAVYPKPPVILLSHLHLDHVIGLGMFPGLSRRGQKTRLFVPFCENGDQVLSLMKRLYAPPFWPLELSEYEGELDAQPFPAAMRIGELIIETMKGNHPGGSLVIRLLYHGKSVVYATDYEYTEASFSALAAFSEHADLLLYDAQYDDEEYEQKKGFGHSTARKGLELQRASGAKRLMLIHHDPKCTDDVLLQREQELTGAQAAYAREGQTVVL